MGTAEARRPRRTLLQGRGDHGCAAGNAKVKASQGPHALSVGVDRRAISNDSPELVERLPLPSRGDELSPSISIGNGDSVDRLRAEHVLAT